MLGRDESRGTLARSCIDPILQLAVRLVLAYAVLAGIATLVRLNADAQVPKFLLGFAPGVLGGWGKTTTRRQRWAAAGIVALVSMTVVLALAWWAEPRMQQLSTSRTMALVGVQAVGGLFVGALALLGMWVSRHRTTTVWSVVGPRTLSEATTPSRAKNSSGAHTRPRANQGAARDAVRWTGSRRQLELAARR